MVAGVKYTSKTFRITAPLFVGMLLLVSISITASTFNIGTLAATLLIALWFVRTIFGGSLRLADDVMKIRTQFRSYRIPLSEIESVDTGIYYQGYSRIFPRINLKNGKKIDLKEFGNVRRKGRESESKASRMASDLNDLVSKQY